jgi:4-hydroxy-3-polyprenylbenzoate decarboxylase
MSENASSNHAAPFRSVRDYITALDDAGLLLRIPKFDQDRYESTAFAYRLIERCGYNRAPAFLFDQVRVDGQWLDGPVIGGAYGNWIGEAMCFGLTGYRGPDEAFTATLAKVSALREANGFPHIPPTEIPREAAPVKEVVLRGDEVDLTRFPFLKTNPSDAGRYINSGSLVLQDAELGGKISVYRCQLQGPRQISVNPEPGQSGWRFLQAMIERGDETAPVVLVLGADPITYGVAGAALATPGQTEFGIVGGIMGRPLEVVPADTVDVQVPAHAEMIIEGHIPLNQRLPEGPFAEFYGVMGAAKTENFYMDVTAVTHRTTPWFLNSYSGVIRNAIGVPREAHLLCKYRDKIPGLLAIHAPQQAAGVHVVCIEKRAAGQGLAAGKTYIQGEMLPKVVVVVDREISPYRLDDVWQVLGARWQPYLATEIIEDAMGLPLDPSLREPPRSSKIVIDATPQLPGEGGPEQLAANSKWLFLQACPDGLRQADDLLDELGL